MNRIQYIIFETILSILRTEKIQDYYKESVISYGIRNYVAKYSLAKDTYFVTKKSFLHLEKFGFIKKGYLMRSIKSKKNGFTYEHPVPSKVVCDLIMQQPRNEDRIKEILSKADAITILTSDEDSLLRKELQSKMPVGWTIQNGNIFQRYCDVGICSQELTDYVKVLGKVKR